MSKNPVHCPAPSRHQPERIVGKRKVSNLPIDNMPVAKEGCLSAGPQDACSADEASNFSDLETAERKPHGARHGRTVAPTQANH